MINLKKKYKTRNGRKVRALKAFKHKIPGSINIKTFIKGQVHMADALNGGREDWVWQMWEDNGKHQFACAFKGYLHPLDLVEIPVPVVPKVDLFRNQFVPRNGVEQNEHKKTIAEAGKATAIPNG